MGKRHHFLKLFTAGLVGLFTSWLAAAQSACPALVEKALAEIGDNCGGLSRNSACYGYNRVDATFTETSAADFFSRPADRAGLVTLETIQTAPLDAALERWGIAVVNAQANVPNTLPGQGVVFLLLGDVQVDNAVPPEQAFLADQSLTVTTLTQSNLRSSPSLKANVVGNLPPGALLPADGLSADKGWVRVVFDEAPGWISRQLVAAESGDLDALPVISRENRSPMQSFYFTTGIGAAACNEAPPSLLVIQGPKKVVVDISANGANITLGSTIALRLLEGNRMQLIVIDGGATAGGVRVPAGFTLDAPLSEDGKSPAGPWEHLRPLTQPELDELMPLENIIPLLLHYPIRLPRLADILATQAALLGGQVIGGATSGPAAGKAICRGFRPTSPLGRLPYEMLPFYWDPADSATAYRLNIYNSAGLAFSGEAPASHTSMTVDAAGLPGGPDFTWEVVALVDGEVACTTGRAAVARDPAPGGDSGPAAPGGPAMTASWSCTGPDKFVVNYSGLPAGTARIIIDFAVAGGVTSPPPGSAFSVSSSSGSIGYVARPITGPVIMSAGVLTAFPSGKAVGVTPGKIGPC